MQTRLHDVEAGQVKQWIDDGDALLIDVREVEEFNEEYIPRAQLFPISSLDPYVLPRGEGKKVVFHCKGGRRSAAAALKWADHAGAPDAYHLRGGIDAWKRAGFSTLSNLSHSKNIQKKAYIGAGSLILLGTLLAWIFSSWFLIFPAIAGIILLYAGFAGTSMLSYLLSKLLSKR